MTMTITPAPPEAESHSILESCRSVRAEIDRVLDTLPERRLEARRMITRELQIDPSAEELQTIERMAHDPAGRGEQRDLSRTALAAHVVADRELRELFDAKELDVSRISRAAQLLPGLLQTVTVLENEIRSRADQLGDDERDYLLQVGNSLMPSPEPLVAATVLVPRILFFMRAIREQDPRSVVPALTEEDIELIRAAIQAADAPVDGSSRLCVNALALRTLIEDDLAAWRDADGADGLPRALILERLERDKTAYRVISARLQEQQDTALVAGLDGFAEELRRVKQQLFSVYLKLAGVLNDPTGAAISGEKSEEETRARLERLLQQCSDADAIAEAARVKHVSKEQLYLHALQGMSHPESAPPPAHWGIDELKREKLRVKLLATITGVLLVALIAVYWTLPGGRPAEPRIPTVELPDALNVIDAVAVGPMMYAQVSRWTWDDLAEADKLAKVDELAESVRQRGFQTLYVTDEDHRDLAMWTVKAGTKLSGSGSEQPAPDGTTG